MASALGTVDGSSVLDSGLRNMHIGLCFSV